VWWQSCAKVEELDAEWHHRQSWAIKNEHLGKMVVWGRDYASDVQQKLIIWGWLPGMTTHHIYVRLQTPIHTYTLSFRHSPSVLHAHTQHTITLTHTHSTPPPPHTPPPHKYTTHIHTGMRACADVDDDMS